MLTQRSDKPEAIQARMRRQLRRHWDEPRLPASIGCPTCPQFGICGGLHTDLRQFDCLAHCCGNLPGCTKVCRNKPREFTEHIREIGGFDLSTTPRSPALAQPRLPAFVPVHYHKGRRANLLARPAVALPLYALLNKRDGTGKFSSRAALCESFGVASETMIVLTGTDQDPPLERWWRYGETRRREAIAYLRRLDIALVTTPNYSLFANMPRWDDLHSMKRIAIVQAEFTAGGVCAALHVNGRTERDFKRWAAFLSERPEITHVAYEFGTGAGFPDRMPRHVEWLIELAGSAGRPLTLLVRGGLESLPTLAQAYDTIVFLDTAVFMKTMKRQRADRVGNAGVKWRASPTGPEEMLDELYEHNNINVEEAVNLLAAKPLEKPLMDA